VHPFTRGKATGKTVAVVGAGPAGLSCAHRLAMKGHDVVIFDARPKAGGLNEYGLAAYKTTDNFAQQELAWLLKIGGITVKTGMALGRDFTLAELQADHDAVFLGMGLAGVNALRAKGEDQGFVRNAIDFISELRQAPDRSSLPVGRNVVVIGGGMTAVDAAVQSKLLGAECVTIVYRRGQEKMAASTYEQEHATSAGVRILTNAAPVEVLAAGAVEFAYTEDTPDGLKTKAETCILPADMVLKAIGQTLAGTPDGLKIEGGKIAVDAKRRTSLKGVWAGGDCASGGEDLTVTAVAEGRDAAEDIHAMLVG
jgi:dihydropyrimidine dehydrogenase (NAD+) subunit PreT